MVETTAVSTSSKATDARSAATARFLRAHFQARAIDPVGRAVIGLPASQRSRSSAIASARCVPSARVLLQALEHDRLQVAVQPRPDRRRPRRLRLADLAEERQDIVARERRPAGEALVEDHPQAVHVDRDGQVLAAGGLLRGHVLRRAQHLAGLGDRALAGRQPLRQAEVGDQPRPLGIDQHVRGLQVAVQHPAPVRVVHGASHVDQARDLRANRAAGVPCQRGPLDVFHRIVLMPVVFADLVDRHDMRMIQVRGGLGLGAKPLHVAAGGEVAGEDHLERHRAVERHLPRLVDDPHAAPGDLLQQFVVAEVADHRRRSAAVRLGLAGLLQAAIQPQGRGHAIHPVEIGEEGAEGVGVLGVAIEQLLAIGDLAALDGQHVGGDGRVERVVGHRGIVRR